MVDPADESVHSEAAGDVSVRQRCAGWRFSSSRPRLTVTEFCRRRHEAKKRQRSADDSISVNDSIASAATKRRRTALKVIYTFIFIRQTKAETTHR